MTYGLMDLICSVYRSVAVYDSDGVDYDRYCSEIWGWWSFVDWEDGSVVDSYSAGTGRGAFMHFHEPL